MSKKMMLWMMILCSLYPESRDILACNGYAISTWHHAFLIAFLQPLTCTSCLALLSVIFITMVSLPFSSLLLKRSLECLLSEPRFELYGKNKPKQESPNKQTKKNKQTNKEKQTNKTSKNIYLLFSSCYCAQLRCLSLLYRFYRRLG